MEKVLYSFVCFFFKQKTAYEMRISDWSSDVCSSDLHRPSAPDQQHQRDHEQQMVPAHHHVLGPDSQIGPEHLPRSEEHTSELQSLMRISYAVFCLKKKTKITTNKKK